MLTKITITYPTNKSYFKEIDPRVYGEYNFGDLIKDLSKDVEYYTKLLKLVEAINSLNDNSNIGATIEAITGITPDINQKTKTKKVYFIPFLYIHETIN